MLFCLSAMRACLSIFAGGENEKVWQGVCIEGPKQGRDAEKENGRTLTCSMIMTMCMCVCVCVCVYFFVHIVVDSLF